MKNLLNLLFVVTLSAFFVSCDSSKDSVTPTPTTDENPGTATGAVTPVGTPEGGVITATIGAAGGKIESADKRIQITIPANALTSDQTISVQPLSNNCPAGTGLAFRLLPHGINFAKPAFITFQYAETDVNASTPTELKIAFQNDKGIWQSPKVKSLDTTARTITVQTSHFSDWGMFKKTFIYPENPVLDPGGNVHLRVLQVVEVKNSETDNEDVFVPLPEEVSSKYIEKWTLRGEGTLKHEYSSGDYYAPSAIPAINPAAITVFLNKTEVIDGQVFKDLRLVSNVFVAPEGISIQMDGGAWRTYPGGANINSTKNVITGMDGKETVSVGWIGAPSGVFRWTRDANVNFNLNKTKLVYQHLYGTGASVSGGSVVVDGSDKIWVNGTFTVQPSGWIDLAATPVQIGTASIKGIFRVKRVN
jgi:hypothetical protein